MKILALLFTFNTLTQAAEPAKITLGWTIKEGLNASLEIQSAEAERRRIDSEYKLAQSKIFPVINGVASGGTRKNSAAYRVGSQVSILDANETYSAGFELDQPLYAGGAISSGLALTRTNREIAKQNLYATKQNYVFSLIENYLLAAEKQVNLDLARDNRDILKKYFQITSQYAAIGRSKNVDRLQAQSNFNLSEAEVLKAESEYESALQAMFRFMGKSKPDNAQVETNLLLQQIEVGTLDQLYQKALENNPSIRATTSSVDAQKYSNDLTMSVHKPTLNLKGNWGYDSPDRVNLIESRAETYSLTLNLKIPLFSGLDSFSQRQINSEQLVVKQKDLAIQQRNLHNSLSQALATLNRDFARLKLTQDSATISRKAMDVAIRDYRNGLLSSTDVLNIQRTRFESDRQYLTAQYSYHRQVLTLRRDLGIDLEKSYVR